MLSGKIALLEYSKLSGFQKLTQLLELTNGRDWKQYWRI
jgi:hypothetical protein